MSFEPSGREEFEAFVTPLVGLTKIDIAYHDGLHRQSFMTAEGDPFWRVIARLVTEKPSPQMP